MAATLEELRIKVAVLKAQAVQIIKYNPYEPVALTATVADLEGEVAWLTAFNEAVEVVNENN